MSETPIPKETMRMVRASVRFQLLSLMNHVMASTPGATISRTATRLGKSERFVRRVLEGRTKLTLRMISDIFWAIDGAMLQFTLEPKNIAPETAETQAQSTASPPHKPGVEP